MSKKMPAQVLEAEKIETIKQQIAYQMWEDEGRPEGRSAMHWSAACEVVDQMLTNTAELPAWFRRVEQQTHEAEPQEPVTRFQDVARRFARGT